MKFVTLAAPVEQFDQVALRCVIDQPFHPENALQVMRQVRHLRPLAGGNEYTAVLRQADTLLDRLGLAAEYRPAQDELTLDQARGYLDGLDDKLSALERQIADLRQEIVNDTSEREQLEKLSGLDVDLSQLKQMDFLRFRYGYLPRETYDSFQDALEGREDLFFFPTKTEEELVYGFYFTTRQDKEKVDTLFNSLHFVRLELEPDAAGTADEAIDMLRHEAEDDEKKVHGLEDQVAQLARQESGQLLAVRSWLRCREQVSDLRRYAARSKSTFYLLGWVPEDDLPALAERFRQFSDLSVVTDDPGEELAAKPPTKLKNGLLGRIFEPFLRMYGLPSYNEIDPSLFMAITYCLFFGIMFGDVGQGVGLFLIGLALARFKKMWLGKIIACCGVASTVFGFVYGSVFGFEDILPGFKILEGNNVVLLLVASLAMGVVMLAFVMVVNIINGVRQRDFDKILFGPNGAAGMVFYLGLIIAAVVTLATGFSLFRVWYVLPVLVLPLILILLREPLSKLAAGDPDWKPESVGGLLVSGFFELFETMLSFLTNTLSFLRVGAYAITHVSLMLVIRTMAGADLNPIVLVLGNLFVMGFEGLLVGIQVLRLEFYELFGRFYTSSGREYSPKVIDYSAKSV